MASSNEEIPSPPTRQRDDSNPACDNLTQAPSLSTGAQSEEMKERSPGGHGNRRKEGVDDNRVPDASDTRWLGWGQSVTSIRPRANMPVERDALYYKMDHKKRGLAIILVNENFNDLNLKPRTCARHDTDIVKHAFELLGFQVEEHWNLKTQECHQILRKVSKCDHQENDCLVVVFMSHGNIDNNREFLCTRDGKVYTTQLWESFTADKCPSLAGKPKLFFIQACRGDNIDKGVQMKRNRALKVQTDSLHDPENYVIPLHADILIMWASYPGMFAFKSMNNGINGSVFIHFLSKVLEEEGQTTDLSTLLLRVTREVATLYESYSPDFSLLHQNKQIPYTVSTLMRKVCFPVRM